MDKEKSTISSEKQKPRPNDNRPNMIVTKNTNNTPIARTKTWAMTPTGVEADQVLLHRPQQDRKSIPTRKEKTGASR